MNPFHNYHLLIQKIDEKCGEIQTDYHHVIQCRKGCFECCCHISIFPVEAAFISNAFKRLPQTIAGYLLHNDLHQRESAPCPLLLNGVCLLYDARPIICRTHGFPLLMNRHTNPFIDFCPHNFSGISFFKDRTVIDMEQVNTALSLINRLFISQNCPEEIPERILMSDGIRHFFKYRFSDH